MSELFGPGESRPGMTTVQKLVCAMAAIGFAFDIYELLMLPVILKPALAELGGKAADGTLVYAPGSPAYLMWARTLFFVPAMVGGIFGLLGGYLTDLLGRRRILTWSILLYAFSAFASGFVTDVYQLLILRCLVFAGVCVEFVAAVAWLAELFDEPKQRERVLGYTQAFSSVGGLLVGLMFLLIARYSASLPTIAGGHETWRYMLISGVIPALPLIFIRPFLPESPKWEQKRKAGLLKRPSILELFAPGLARTTIITTLCYAASYGMAFGAIQQLAQILPAHKQIVTETANQVAAVTAKSTEPIPPGKVKAIEGKIRDEAVGAVTIWQEVGGLVGRLILAMLAVQIVSRRKLLRIFQIPSLIVVPLVFIWISQSLQDESSMFWIKIGIFACGVVVVSQFSFWGNYIPRVFPLHLRGTGESFAANIGGRIIGTAAAFLTLTFAESKPPDPSKIAYVGAIVAGCYCLVGIILTFLLPEPSSNDLGE
ncbi:MAG: MFS transporter [Pirellulaceae bacterium]